MARVVSFEELRLFHPIDLAHPLGIAVVVGVALRVCETNVSVASLDGGEGRRRALIAIDCSEELGPLLELIVWASTIGSF